MNILPSKYYLLIGIFFSLSINIFGQSVTTDPVGYMTITVNGSPDGLSTAFTGLSMDLENAPSAKGSLTEVPSSAVATNTGASYAVGEFASLDASGNSSHYLQFVSNGLIVDIIANDATTITTGTDLTGLVAPDANGDIFYVVKKHVTLADVFGADNTAGLKAGSNFATSDLVYIMSTDGNGTFATYYVQNDPTPVGFLGGDGWRQVGAPNNEDKSNVVIGPDDGIIIARSDAGDLDIVVTGNVNVIDHQRDLPPGFSMVSYPYPLDVTLDESNIYTDSNGYVSNSSFATSDLVYIIGSDGAYTTYYRQNDPTPVGFLGGDGWRQVGAPNNEDKGSVIIPAGSSIIIKHTGTGLAWSDVKPF